MEEKNEFLRCVHIFGYEPLLRGLEFSALRSEKENNALDKRKGRSPSGREEMDRSKGNGLQFYTLDLEYFVT
jgi:hypothetical protein